MLEMTTTGRELTWTHRLTFSSENIYHQQRVAFPHLDVTLQPGQLELHHKLDQVELFSDANPVLVTRGEQVNCYIYLTAAGLFSINTKCLRTSQEPLLFTFFSLSD